VRGARGEGGDRGAPPPRAGGGGPDGGDGQQEYQGDLLGADEGREAADGPERHRDRGTGPLQVAVGEEGGDRDHRDEERLRVEEAVEQPEVGVEGGDHGGDDPGAGPCETPREERHRDDGSGSEQCRPDLVVERAPQPDHRRHAQEDRVRRRMRGPGDDDLSRRDDEPVRVDEAVTGRQEVGALVVVDGVTAQRRRVHPDQDVSDPHRQSDGGGAQDPPPPGVSRCRVCPPAPDTGHRASR